MADSIGTRLGDFEIVRELGRGGMGVVFEARQLSLNRRVALKVLSGGLGLTPKAVQRFQREAEAAAKLHHTNIVPVYAIGEEDGTHFYAMELIDGPSLDHVIRQMRAGANATDPTPTASEDRDDLAQTGPYITNESNTGVAAGLSSSSLASGIGYFDTVARMVAEVADALEYAHQQGVIHRDIKPSNLLLSPAGRLSVNDFGLARMLEQPGMTVTGEFVGTPAYMSPEQITAGRIRLDHRTDIYSLGATLYELLTGQPPHMGASREQVLTQIVQKEPKAPRRLQKKAPLDLETICLKCLEKDPDRRYATAGALADDLRRYLNRFAISARRAGPWTRAKKWAKRNPALAAAFASGCVLVLVAAFFAYQVYRSEQIRLAEKREQEQRLLITQRENTLEKALLAAMSGELNQAEKAIQEAERQGVSLGQVRLLRGEVAYYRGQAKEAIEHLEQAVSLLPVAESAGARGLLIVAYVYSMRWDDGARLLSELEPIQPVSMEDFLFKGAAVSQWDPEKGLAILNEAVKQRPSSAVARMFRVDPRLQLAEERADPELADLAIEDAETAKRLLADTSPYALCVSAVTYQLAAFVYKAARLQEKHQRTLALASKDAEALRPFMHLPFAAYVRSSYFWHFDQKDRTLEELRLLPKKLETPLVALTYARILYWRGAPADLRELCEILRRAEGNASLALLYCYAVAELQGRDAALKLVRREFPRAANGLNRIYFDSLPLLLGRKELVRAASRADLQLNLDFPPRDRAFLRKLCAYFAGDVAEADLLRAANDSQKNACQAHYFIGVSRLADGDRAGAREQFQRAVDTSFPNHSCHVLSVVFLKRLEKDPNWPPWIPVKKQQRSTREKER